MSPNDESESPLSASPTLEVRLNIILPDPTRFPAAPSVPGLGAWRRPPAPRSPPRAPPRLQRGVEKGQIVEESMGGGGS